jgi:hypothetical protein
MKMADEKRFGDDRVLENEIVLVSKEDERFYRDGVGLASCTLRGGMGGAEGIEGTRTRCLMVREHEV